MRSSWPFLLMSLCWVEESLGFHRPIDFDPAKYDLSEAEQVTDQMISAEDPNHDLRFRGSAPDEEFLTAMSGSNGCRDFQATNGDDCPLTPHLYEIFIGRCENLKARGRFSSDLHCAMYWSLFEGSWNSEQPVNYDSFLSHSDFRLRADFDTLLWSRTKNIGKVISTQAEISLKGEKPEPALMRLENTPTGELLDGLNWCKTPDAAGNCPQDVIIGFWVEASKIFARQASPTVHIILQASGGDGAFRKNSILGSVEIPELNKISTIRSVRVMLLTDSTHPNDGCAGESLQLLKSGLVHPVTCDEDPPVAQSARCVLDSNYPTCSQRAVHARHCRDIQAQGKTESGVYVIQPTGAPEPFRVYCDMHNDGGGWTLLIFYSNTQTPLAFRHEYPNLDASTTLAEPLTTFMYKGPLGDFTEAREVLAASGSIIKGEFKWGFASYGRELTSQMLDLIRSCYGWAERLQTRIFTDKPNSFNYPDVPPCYSSLTAATPITRCTNAPLPHCTPAECTNINTNTVLGWYTGIDYCWAGRGLGYTGLGSAMCDGTSTEPNGSKWAAVFFR